ncbi:MAG: hypothetical protein SWC96_12245, partial [Thermodesulfobacteriota bacterium]|nr:hypothetical protein [Thermodesulfobacteriota bacterium]
QISGSGGAPELALGRCAAADYMDSGRGSGAGKRENRTGDNKTFDEIFQHFFSSIKGNSIKNFTL